MNWKKISIILIILQSVMILLLIVFSYLQRKQALEMKALAEDQREMALKLEKECMQLRLQLEKCK